MFYAKKDSAKFLFTYSNRVVYLLLNYYKKKIKAQNIKLLQKKMQFSNANTLN